MVFPEWQDLTTERLLLRKIAISDREDYFHLFSSPETAKYMLWEPHTSMAQTDAALEKLMGRYDAGRCYRWGITLRGENALVGILELLGFDEGKGTCTFAFQLAPEHTGRGYGSEALAAAFGFAFSRMEVDAIEADHMGPNLASGAAMKKAGMTCRGVVPGKYTKNGETYDAPQYRITREEWEKQQEYAEKRLP